MVVSLSLSLSPSFVEVRVAWWWCLFLFREIPWRAQTKPAACLRLPGTLAPRGPHNPNPYNGVAVRPICSLFSFFRFLAGGGGRTTKTNFVKRFFVLFCLFPPPQKTHRLPYQPKPHGSLYFSPILLFTCAGLLPTHVNTIKM